jgi:hypothetical protein
MKVDELDALRRTHPRLLDDRGDEVGYDVGLICENGHDINDSVLEFPEYNADFCPKCGARGIYKCECGEPVRGGVLGVTGDYRPPAHCTGCGRPHVWTTRRLQALRELITELDGLSSDEKTQLSDSVANLVTETSMTDTAVVRIKKAIPKIKSAEIAKVFISVLKDVAVAAALKKMGL